jgi:hypothetical protein
MAHPVRRFTKGIMVSSNIAIALLFLLGCYGYWFDPKQFWFTGFLTLSSFYFLLILLGFFFFLDACKTQIDAYQCYRYRTSMAAIKTIGTNKTEQ